MIFGLPECSEDSMDVSVGELFEAISEKPRFEVCRVGKKISGGTARPVKVTTSSATIVDHILYKAKRLKQTIKFKTVFLSPDRSLEQREKHRQLVLDLKKKTLEEPSKKHYIKNGTIVSVEKSAI